MQSIETTDGSEPKGETLPRRNVIASEGLVGPSAECSSLFAAFLKGLKASENAPCLGSRTKDVTRPEKQYTWQTYSEVNRQLLAFGDGLVELGIAAGETEARVAIWSPNRPEWTIAEYACMRLSFTVVSLYDTLGSTKVAKCLKHTKTQAVVLPAEKVLSLAKARALAGLDEHIRFSSDAGSSHDLFSDIGATPASEDAWTMYDIALNGEYSADNLIYIVLDAQNLPKKAAMKCKALGIQLYPFEEVVNLGHGKEKEKNDSVEPPLPNPETIATIVYTSGTSGKSKAAVLTHGNFCANLAALELAVENGHLPSIKGTDMVHFSYLPLSHVYERQSQAFVLLNGGSIGFSSRDNLRLLEDISILRPTVLCSVPLLLERIMARIQEAAVVQAPVATYMFNTAIEQKLQVLRSGLGEKSWMFDRWVLNSVREKLGGRLKWILSGSAPLTTQTMEFLRVSLSVQTSEGYGLSETAAVISMSNSGDWEAGHVGPPLASCEIKLVDVPGAYTSGDHPYPRGQIFVRGPNVFSGYLSDCGTSITPTVDSSGWLATGDVGSFDEHGRLRIIDRLGDVFKLSGGMFVAPAQVELALLGTPEVSQVWAYGDPSKPSVVALVVVNEVAFLRWLEDEGVELEMEDGVKRIQMGTKERVESACRDEQVKRRFLRRLRARGKEAGLKGLELPVGVHLGLTPFAQQDARLITPTLKKRRGALIAHFGPVIESLYVHLDL